MSDKGAYFIDAAIQVAISIRCASARAIWAEKSPSTLVSQSLSVDLLNKKFLMRSENVGVELGVSRPILSIVIFTRRCKDSGIDPTHGQSRWRNLRGEHTRYENVWYGVVPTYAALVKFVAK